MSAPSKADLQQKARERIGVFEAVMNLILNDKKLSREQQHEQLSAFYGRLPMSDRPMFREAMMLRLCGLTSLEVSP